MTENFTASSEPIAKTGAVLAVVRTGLVLVTAFGLDLTKEQIVAVQAAAEAVLQLFVVGALPPLADLLPWRTVRDRVYSGKTVEGAAHDATLPPV